MSLLTTESQKILDSINSPDASRIIRNISIIIFIVSVLILVFVPWQQTSYGQGKVVAFAPLDRQQNIDAPVDGRVKHWHVVEGQKIRKGDLILEIVDNDPELIPRLKEERDAVLARISANESRSKAIRSRIKSLEGSKDNAISAASSRYKMSLNRVHAAEEMLASSNATFRVAKLNVERQKSLFEKGLSAERTVELAEMEFTRAQTEVSRANAALEAARSEERALKSDELKASTDMHASIDESRAADSAALAERANAMAELPRVETRLNRQKAQIVISPRDGTIMRQMAFLDGDMVKAGDHLAILVPDSNVKAVEIWIDGNDVPFVREDSEVRLQFQGFPAIQVSGWPEAAMGTFAGKIAFIDPSDNHTGQFRVMVLPNEKWPTVRQGTRANGWIFLSQVSVGFELWRRMNNFPPIMKENQRKEILENKK
ncbi:MAG: HlyD family secretion protein [Leptospira sp.]|nr:HlyD family secretion protein [Leptospira sp.]